MHAMYPVKDLFALTESTSKCNRTTSYDYRTITSTLKSSCFLLKAHLVVLSLKQDKKCETSTHFHLSVFYFTLYRLIKNVT